MIDSDSSIIRLYVSAVVQSKSILYIQISHLHALVQPTYIIYYIHFLDGSDLNSVLEIICNLVPQATTTTLIEGTTRLPARLMSYTYMLYVGSFFQGLLAHKYFMLVMYLFLVFCFSLHTHVYANAHLNTHTMWDCPIVNKKQGDCDYTNLSTTTFRNFRSQKWQQLMRTLMHRRRCAVRLLWNPGWLS